MENNNLKYSGKSKEVKTSWNNNYENEDYENQHYESDNFIILKSFKENLNDLWRKCWKTIFNFR